MGWNKKVKHYHWLCSGFITFTDQRFETIRVIAVFFFNLSSRSVPSWVHSQGPNLGSVSFSLNISSGLISPGRKHPSSSPSLLQRRASGAAFGSGKATAWPRAPAQGPPATHTSVIMQLGPFYFRPIIWSTLTQRGFIKRCHCMLHHEKNSLSNYIKVGPFWLYA